MHLSAIYPLTGPRELGNLSVKQFCLSSTTANDMEAYWQFGQ